MPEIYGRGGNLDMNDMKKKLNDNLTITELVAKKSLITKLITEFDKKILSIS